MKQASDTNDCSNQPKALILGATGQVGQALIKQLASSYQLATLSRADQDFTDLDALQLLILQHKPSLIINAAAYTAVDKAESSAQERALAFRLNAELPTMLAATANRLNAMLVHYSSDYVYPGVGDEPHEETSATAPLNAYGLSKLAGDEAIQSSCQQYLILRTSWVYSATGQNFMNTMLRLAESKAELQVVNDQYGAPTSAGLIARITEKLLVNDAQGLYHLCANGETTWAEFAQAIFHMQKLNVKVNGIATEAYPTPAKRPKNSRLCLQKLEKQLGISLPHWQDDLANVLAERNL